MAQNSPAVLGPVESSVRPVAWMVRQGMRTYYVSDAEFVRSSYDAGSFTPLYGPEALAAERERCAAKAGEYARKWWTEHCRSNHHMATTRKAHDDFCALQVDIRRA